MVSKLNNDTYQAIIESRRQWKFGDGFDPTFMPGYLKPFQRDLVEWLVRKGRAAIFADCGLGKTIMQLVYAQNVHLKTGKPVIIATPLAVAHQTVLEAAKFGIEAELSRDGKINSSIVVTNYQQLHKFDPLKFGGMVGDESSVTKDAKSKTKAEVKAFTRKMKFRGLFTATAAPNDWHELGTSSEILGGLGWRDMITMFFKQEQSGGFQGWARAKYRFREHAKISFWRWVCSWAKACRKPSDLGHSDEGYELDPMHVEQFTVRRRNVRDGFLFSIPARSLEEQREERRATITERCEKAASLCDKSDYSVVWCHLNEEGDRLRKMIDDCVEVSGKDTDESKEEKLVAFSSGQIKRLVIKPKIGAWGLNWQHCNNVITFPSHSYEQYYQAVRRCWRFGQKRTVNVSIVTTEGEEFVMKNLERKSRQADEMFSALVSEMNGAKSISPDDVFPNKEGIPQWL